MTLRDHSKPCEHGGANYRTGEDWFCESCPGGREVTATEALEWALAEGAKFYKMVISMPDWDDDA